MTAPFNHQQGLIVVSAVLEGPLGYSLLQLALDTGATDTAVSTDLLRSAGYDPLLARTVVPVTTGSGVVQIPVITVAKLSALGHGRTRFLVLGLTLPPSAGVDGVLGLDFLRGTLLTIDFRSGQLALT